MTQLLKLINADVIYSRAFNKDLQTLQKKCLKLCLGRDRFYSMDAAHTKMRFIFSKIGELHTC